MGRQLDLLIVNPGSRAEIYQGLADELTAIEPPLWAGMLATHVRGKDYSVEILDADALQLSPNKVAEHVAAQRPRLTAVVVYGHQPSASTQNMAAAGQICQQIKVVDPTRPVVLIGGHVSALPEHTLTGESADFVAQGEGAQALTGLLEYFRNGASRGLDTIPGLWYRDPIGGVRANLPASPSGNIDDDYPGVAWDLLPMERYRAHNWHCFGDVSSRQPYASIYTSLGCPYKCTFCCINAPFRIGPDQPNAYRLHSAQQVLGELTMLHETYGVRNLKIADEMFVLNDKHVLGLCEGIVQRRLDLNIWAYARVDTVKTGLLEPLKRAGVNWLALGIESASKHVRDGVEKGRFGSEQIVDVVRSIKAAGINVIGNFIFGLPDDDLTTMQETLDLALELKCEMANFYSAMAYPGSKLYDLAVQSEWELPKTWTGFSQHAYDTLPLPTEFVSAGEVLGFRDYAFQAYFRDPTYLALVRARFGADTEAHIREMVDRPLARLHAIAPLR